MEKRYSALRIIGTLYKILAILVALFTLLLVILTVYNAVTFNAADMTNMIGVPIVLDTGVLLVVALTIVVIGGLGALSLFTIGEMLNLLVGLEENTRFTAYMLREQMRPTPPPNRPYS